MRCYILFPALIFFLFSCHRNHRILEERLDTILDTIIVESGPGCGIAVVHHDQTILLKGYGLANLEHEIPFEPHTVSDLGSVAKHFTAYAIAKLEDDGDLDFDDEIQDHLDWIPSEIRKKDITISNLIHHTSGLREIYGALAIGGFRSGDGITQEDGQTLVRNSEELNFEPGEQYNYCNTAYMMLADIIESASKSSYEDYMQKYVFNAQGMDHTYVMDLQGEVFPNASSSYRTLEDGSFATVYDNSTAYGQGGIYTSIVDMAEWMKNLLDASGNHEDIFETMQTRGILNNGDTLDYAFGLNISAHRGLKQISHSGASAGYRSLISLYPEQELGIFIQSNYGELQRNVLLNKILDVVLDSLPALNQVEDGSEEDPLYLTLERSVLNDYAGEFFSPELQVIYELTIEDGKLMAHHRRNGSFELKAVDQDTFHSEEWYFQDIAFERNLLGNVNGFRLSNGRVMGLLFEKQ